MHNQERETTWQTFTVRQKLILKPFQSETKPRKKSLRDQAQPTFKWLQMCPTQLFKKIRATGNSADKDGITEAHRLIWDGYCFTVDQILLLGNPATSTETFKYFYYHDFRDDSDCLFRAGIRSEILPGETLAHSMAKVGYRFSEEEILRLGNPRCGNGHSLSEWVDKYQK